MGMVSIAISFRSLVTAEDFMSVTAGSSSLGRFLGATYPYICCIGWVERECLNVERLRTLTDGTLMERSGEKKRGAIVWSGLRNYSLETRTREVRTYVGLSSQQSGDLVFSFDRGFLG